MRWQVLWSKCLLPGVGLPLTRLQTLYFMTVKLTLKLQLSCHLTGDLVSISFLLELLPAPCPAAAPPSRCHVSHNDLFSYLSFPSPRVPEAQTILDGNSGSRFFVEVLGVLFLFHFVTSVSQLSTMCMHYVCNDKKILIYTLILCTWSCLTMRWASLQRFFQLSVVKHELLVLSFHLSPVSFLAFVMGMG